MSPTLSSGDACNHYVWRLPRILKDGRNCKHTDSDPNARLVHDIEGFEHKEIAEMRGRTEGTSKSQLHKARRALRALITQLGPEQIALGRNLA